MEEAQKLLDELMKDPLLKGYTPRILKIAKLGHPILNQEAKEVDPLSLMVREHLADMLKTLVDFGPVAGLAAPQVYIPYKIALYIVSGKKASDSVPLTILLNPKIENIGNSKEEDIEACLSVPHFYGLVPRYSKVRVKYQNLKGELNEIIASGYHARVLQHECDHLKGDIYLYKMNNLRNLNFNE